MAHHQHIMLNILQKKTTLKLDEIGKMLKIPPFAVPFMSKTVIVT